MKNRNYLLMLALIMGLLLTVSCEKEETPMEDNEYPTEMTIAGIASSNDDFSILVEALVKADLVTTLDGEGSFTLFAPDNNAFTNLFNAPGVMGIEDIPVETLKPILLYHVLGSPVFSDEISSGIIESLNSQDPEIVLEVNDMGVMLNGTAKVVATDIVGTNGVIHVIDEVLIP